MGAALEVEGGQRLVRIDAIGLPAQQVLVLGNGLVGARWPEVEVHLGQSFLTGEIVAIEGRRYFHGKGSAFLVVLLERDFRQRVPQAQLQL